MPVQILGSTDAEALDWREPLSASPHGVDIVALEPGSLRELEQVLPALGAVAVAGRLGCDEPSSVRTRASRQSAAALRAGWFPR